LQFCSFVCQVASARTQRSTGFSSGGRGAVAPLWIFIHDINIVDRARLNSAIFRFFSLFFGLFSVAPLPTRRGLIVLFFGHFCNFPVFFRWPPWKFFCRRPCREVTFIWYSSQSATCYYMFNYTNVEASHQVPCPRIQEANLLARSPHYPFNVERQARKL